MITTDSSLRLYCSFSPCGRRLRMRGDPFCTLTLGPLPSRGIEGEGIKLRTSPFYR